MNRLAPPSQPMPATRTNHWQGYRPFVVVHTVRESDTISSFYLVPEDGQPLPQFEPGQYLTFRLEVPGRPEPVFRSYTLSDRPDPARYRVTVKRESGTDGSAPGVGSGYFHDHVRPGTRLWVGAPRGEFCLDPGEPGPVALVSAGVGLTPMISMVNAIVASGARRPVWFIHGARNGREHAMGEHVRRSRASTPTSMFTFATAGPLSRIVKAATMTLSDASTARFCGGC